MFRWRNETQAPVPTYISDVTEAMSQPIWVLANTYDITVADNNTGLTTKKAYHLQAWAVDVERRRTKTTCTLIPYDIVNSKVNEIP